MHIIPLPAFRDNYIWLLRAGDRALVVDPGDAGPVLDYLAAEGLRLAAILVTHHHADHVGGLARCAKPVPHRYLAPSTRRSKGSTIRWATAIRVDIAALGLNFEVLEVPGHTAGHVAYFGRSSSQPILFCGDTLFSAGCGRLFEGTPAQLARSLSRLAALPDDTAVYCTHEYTLSNLAFARAAEPHNPERDAYAEQCAALRDAGRPTLPSSIGREKAINPSCAATSPASSKPSPAIPASDPLTRCRVWPRCASGRTCSDAPRVQRLNARAMVSTTARH
ncbi:hydroxyacylglutathione hydrolase [Thauera humireducens]|uniref:hydroxyacylglutathione hydrolase n=1 Tax=Thauera humireducens TaxID=1134435 RepID=UPI003C7290E9